MGAPHRAFEFLFLVSEIIVIVLYLTCTEYSTATQGQDFFRSNAVESSEETYQEIADDFVTYLPEQCLNALQPFVYECL